MTDPPPVPYTHGEDPKPRNKLQKLIDALVAKLGPRFGKSIGGGQ